MDGRVRKLKTVRECEVFGRNAEERGRSDLAVEARERATEILAEEYGATSVAEKEILQAVFAYEQVLSKKNGRTTRASRTWQMVGKYGLIQTAERAVNRPQETQGYSALAMMGLQAFAFEAVILRHRQLFSEEAVAISRERMSKWELS